MSNSIIAVDFDPAMHLELVRDFACGEEPWEKELASWIQNEAALVRRSIPCRIWLYVTEAKDIIGYGSLAMTRWNFPEPKNNRVALALIPAVAIQKQFWGKPAGPRENRYSALILDHLIISAAQMKIDVPILALFVHPENQRAIKVYERAQFSMFSKTFHDKTTGVTYLSMIRHLAMSGE
jgi:hypothetical protein